jgi:hypothetical protein
MLPWIACVVLASDPMSDSRHGVVRGTSVSALHVAGSMLSRAEQLEDRVLLAAATVNFDSLPTRIFGSSPESVGETRGGKRIF